MITYCPQRVLHCLPLAFPLPHLRGEVPEINVKREVDGMSDKPPLSARETLSEWAERAWQSRREQEPGNNTGRVAPDNGARDADTLEDAIKQRATKWMEEGRFLMGLLEELLNEKEQLRTRAAAFEKDLERLRREGGGLQPEREDIVEVAPKGDLDMASVSQMKLQDYINAGRIKLVLDLESIEYIDSAGLGEIVRAMKRAREAGGDLRLCGVHGPVGTIIEITGLNKAISVYPTRA